MVYLEQFVFILLKISAVLTKGSPPPPHSHHLLLPLMTFAWCWERDLDLTYGQEGSVAAGTPGFSQLVAVAGGDVVVSVKLPLH